MAEKNQIEEELEPYEENVIMNVEIKEQIGNFAVKFLLDNDFIAKKDLNGLTAEFGYLFYRVDGALEGLLRMKCHEESYFMAVQEGKLQLLTIDEEQFYAVIEQMKEYHLCLKGKYGQPKMPA